jgi:transcriptional regulator GlxA family with amidase domain
MPLVVKILPMHRVVALALPEVVAFDLGIPAQIFGSTAPGYSFEVCGPRRRVASDTGFAIAVERGLEALADADTVIVPGIGEAALPFDRAALRALRAAHARGARVASICTGAFVLAAAGLLDGRRATTHWAYTDRLAAEFPSVNVDPNVLYVDEGDVLTSAGLAAGIDLCLHIVRTDRGAEVANAVARHLVVPPHRDGGQAQFVDRPLDTLPQRRLEPTREWMLDHVAAPLTVAEMARHAGYSARSFARHFRAETGATPLQWLLAQRVLLARRLLETTDLTVDEIAREAGFGAAVTLRVHFRRIVGTTPTAYRRTFRGVAA